MKTTTTLSLLALALLLHGSIFAQVIAPGSQPAVVSGPPAATPAAPAPVVPGGGILTFEEETHQFGDLMQGGDASFTFRFTNTGTEAIKIESVKPACGCTTPKSWPQEPIQPGETGEMLIQYDSNRIGGFDKFVTIISNASEVDKKIFIKGNILPKPAEPTYGVPTIGAPAAPSGH